MKSKFSDIITISFAMFSIIFGAGNLIFSTYLGYRTGGNWFYSFIMFVLMDIGLVVLGVFAYLKNNCNQNNVFKPVGKVVSSLLQIISLLIVGPLIAIPRTALTSGEIVLPDSLDVYLILYFVLVFICSFKKSKVVDVIGKYITPILLVGISIFVIVGLKSNVDLNEYSLSVSESISLGIENG